MSLLPHEEIELLRLLEADTPVDNPFPSAWAFMQGAVWTKDEASGTIRKFPDYPYLKRLSEIRKEQRILAIEKSRRMMVTWWMLAEYLYDTLTSLNHANFIGSRKLESSTYLLGEHRLLCMYEHIPEAVWPDKPGLEARGRNGLGFERVVCPATGSYIQAVASGADQLRGFTASNVFLDEFAFFERAEDTWSAVRPTIEGGGHIDICSTPELGAYMYTLLYD